MVVVEVQAKALLVLCDLHIHIGDQDFVDDTSVPRRTALHLNDGTARFQTFAGGTTFSFDELGVRAAAGDFDGDGDADLVGSRSEFLGTPGEIYLQRNDGTGLYALDPATQPTNPYIVESLASGDLDGDGDVDVSVGNTRWTGISSSGIGINFLLRNDGTGSFTADQGSVPQTQKSTWEVMLGDVDQDGDLDSLMANGSANPSPNNELWLNDGSGIYTNAPGLLPPSPGHSFSGELADFDGDGDLDAVLGQGLYQEFSASLARNRYFEFDGAKFVDLSAARLPAHQEFTRAVESGDVDGDGDLDVVLGNSITNDIGASAPGALQPDRLYLNDGSGAFTDATGATWPSVPRRTRNLRLLDVDLDLDLDVVSMSTDSGWGAATVYRNGGGGAFAVAAAELASLATDQVMVVADVDRDGDDDVVTSRYVAYGMARHLTWRTPPRIGADLVLELRGPGPGEPWTLALSGGTSQIPLPPFGVFFLDLFNAYAVFGSGVLDADRTATAGGPVPANPNLVGVTVNFQAVVGGLPHLTNLARATFFDL